MKVNLRTITDETGLSVNLYEWKEGNELRIECEIANRIYGKTLPLRAVPFDQAIDGARAERRRIEIEASAKLREELHR